MKCSGLPAPPDAITGIYAVLAFSVAQRNQEIAIRMTLGAQRASIAQLVLASGGKLALLGCGLGVLGSLAVSQLVGSLLFGVSAMDPFTYAAVAAAVIAAALAASYVPSRGAARTVPLDALRAE